MSSNPPGSDSQQDGTAMDPGAEAAGKEASEADTGSEPNDQSYSPDELQQDGAPKGEPPADVNLDLILDVPVSVSLHVGSTEITIRNLVQLVEGSIVALERKSSEPMDVQVNGTLIAHGEIVVIDDKFGVRLTDVVSPAERIRKIN